MSVTDVYNYTSPDYEVIWGASYLLRPGFSVYQVVNRTTSVIELESHQLTTAIAAAMDFQRGLNDIRSGKLQALAENEVAQLLAAVTGKPH